MQDVISKITPESIINNSINLVNKEYSVDEVLNNILRLCKPFDIKQRAGVGSRSSLSHWQQVVVIIDEIIQLTEEHGWGIVRYKGSIYLYNGMRWRQTEDEKFIRFVGEAAEKMGINPILARHFEYRGKLFNQLQTAIHQAKIIRTEATLINLANGTLEIDEDSVKLRPFDKDDFLTYRLPFVYDPAAIPNKFMKYLDRVLPHTELQHVLAEYIGYLFVPSWKMKMEKSILLYGTGANGKSVFFDVINALLGRDNVSNYSLGKLTDRNGYYRAMIGDKLVNYSSEINRKLDPALFKQLVSGEPVEARLPYGKPFILENYARLMFNTNELPRDVEHSNAYFRRFLIIPFEVAIPQHEQDHRLANRIIRDELPGVLNWVISGLRRLITNQGFTHSELVQKEIEQYRNESDTCLLYIDDKNLKVDMVFHTPLKELYNSYKQFCMDNNYMAFSNRTFKKHLESYGFKTYKASVGVMVCCGKKDG